MIFGHERQKKYFDTVLQNGRLAHAYLLYGPEHVGKFMFAQALAEKLKSVPIVISRNESRKGISIDDIRELKRRFSFAPENGEWRVAMVNDAEIMSAEAANAFLKLLEEPGDQSLFFLIAKSRESLLPTVVSRTHQIYFSLVPDAVLWKFLSDKDIRDREKILAVAAGRPGVMMRCLEEKNFLDDEYQFVEKVKTLLREKDVTALFPFMEKISQSAEMQGKAVYALFSLLRGQLGSGPAVARQLKRISEIAETLETVNVNPRLALDVMFLEAIQC